MRAQTLLLAILFFAWNLHAEETDESNLKSTLDLTQKLGNPNALDSYLESLRLNCNVTIPLSFPTKPNVDPSPAAEASPKPCRADGQKKQNIPLFKSTETLKVTIQSDFATVQAKGGDGTFAIQGGEKNFKFPVTITPRGKTRGNQRGICQQATAHVRFNTPTEPEYAEYKNTPLEHSHLKLKVVNNCRLDDGLDKDSAQKVLAEYALYQIIQASGLPGFDTRLMQVEYLDKAGGHFKTSYAFIIEDTDDMARRYGSSRTTDAVKYGPSYTNTLDLVNSRSDHLWSASDLKINHQTKHNFVTLARNGSAQSVPYDFDANPLVAGYVGQQGERSMDTTSFDTSKEGFETMALVQSNKQKIYAALEKVPFNESSPYRKKIKAWLDSYFAASDTVLSTNGKTNLDVSVKPNEKPKLWFQVSCEEMAQ